jgi:hypothetical protein
LPEEARKKRKENHRIFIFLVFGFQYVAKNVEGLKIWPFNLVNSQIWQNLPMDDCHFLEKKFIEKKRRIMETQVFHHAKLLLIFKKIL